MPMSRSGWEMMVGSNEEKKQAADKMEKDPKRKEMVDKMGRKMMPEKIQKMLDMMGGKKK